MIKILNNLKYIYNLLIIFLILEQLIRNQIKIMIFGNQIS